MLGLNTLVCVIHKVYQQQQVGRKGVLTMARYCKKQKQLVDIYCLFCLLVCLFETGSHCRALPGLQFIGICLPLPGTKGMCHHTLLVDMFYSYQERVK